MYEIRSISDSKKNIENYLFLFSRCFPREKKFNSQYLNWLYFDNPNGTVLGYDAWYNGQIVAHYAAIPALTKCYGKVERSILSVNTSTDPHHQRKGLFLELAKKTYNEASKKGFKSVIGIANKFATPGRIKYLNFQFVSPLSIAIGISSLNVNWSILDDNTDFSVVWGKKSLEWRLRSTGKNVMIKNYRSYHSFFSKRVFGPFIPYLEQNQSEIEIDKKFLITTPPIGIRLFIGLIPTTAKRKNFFLNIPEFLKPSPFNLIYKRLDTNKLIPRRDRLFLNFLDFDVF